MHSAELIRLAEALYEFEAGESRANTGAGSRLEGAKFEVLLADFWSSLIRDLATSAEHAASFRGPKGTRRWTRLTKGNRSLFLPDSEEREWTDRAPERHKWLRSSYSVEELVNAYPGKAEATQRYAPERGPFKGDRYPSMYEGKTTLFDDVILFEESGVLREKMLLEYKTAKSSKGVTMDGNAHERLTFQVMQYLELATRYPKCSLAVISNGAFARYKNKYHVNFHLQADRLAAFSWFNMTHACTPAGYLALAERVENWLLTP
ncbi:MAG: hypothetical protein AAGI52_03335 [Bacteroidota bacterium]